MPRPRLNHNTKQSTMVADIRQLEHLLSTLEGLMAPVTKDNWDDVTEAWMSLAQLRGELTGQRCKTILQVIFKDEGLCNAIGMAYQLRDIDSTVGVPAGLLSALKKDAGAYVVRCHHATPTATAFEGCLVERPCSVLHLHSNLNLNRTLL